MLSNFDSAAASWKDWTFKFKNLAATVFTSSRGTLEWAAQQETSWLNVDDIEASPDTVEIDPEVSVKKKHINKASSTTW